jgi:hypothetical protein
MTTWEGGRGVTKKQSEFLGGLCEVKGAGDVRLREENSNEHSDSKNGEEDSGDAAVNYLGGEWREAS